MKTGFVLLLIGCVAAWAETEERISKSLTVEAGGKLVLDVDFGSVELTAGSKPEVTVEVFRKVKMADKEDEEAFLKERPVTISQDGKTVSIQSRAATRKTWRGSRRTDGKYTVSLPEGFDADVKTSGGNVSIVDLRGKVIAKTSGGSMRFTNLRGDLEGRTSGGNIRVADCTGPVRLHTSGGTIDIQNASAKIDASTSGGNVSAHLQKEVADEVTLKTSGGNVTLRVPEKSAFDLHASTSGGSVSSDLPVQVAGKPKRTELRGPVNGGGKAVLLKTSGGNVHVKKS